MPNTLTHFLFFCSHLIFCWLSCELDFIQLVGEAQSGARQQQSVAQRKFVYRWCFSLSLLLQQPWEQVRGTNCYFLCFFLYDFYKQNTYKQILFKSYQLFCGQVCQFGFHIFISSRTGWLKQLWLADVNNCPPTQMCHCLLPCGQWGLWRWFNALLKRCHTLTSEQCVAESKTITSSQLVSQSLQHGAF